MPEDQLSWDILGFFFGDFVFIPKNGVHSQQIHIFLVRKSKKIINRVSQKEVANRVLGQNQEQWGQIFSWTQLGGLHPAWSLGKKQPKKHIS